MKLHDPATERELMRLAANGRAGRSIEPADRRGIGGLLGSLLNQVVILAVPLLLLGGTLDREMDRSWREFIACTILVMAATNGCSILYQIAVSCGFITVLPNFPIRGERALQMVRIRFFVCHAWGLVAICAIVSYGLNGFSMESVPELFQQSILLSAITGSTVMLWNDERLERLKIQPAWTYMLWGMTAVTFAVFVVNRDLFIEGKTPQWMANLLYWLAWLLPPSWAFSGRFEQGGALLCAAWVIWGAWKWIKWPQVHGKQFDAPGDFHFGFGEFMFDDGDEDAGFEEGIADPACDEKLPEQNSGSALVLPTPLTMAPGGFVDRWIRYVVGVSNQFIAGAICEQGKTWTKQTRTLMMVAPFWLALSWAVSAWFPEGDRKEQVVLWIWFLTIGGVVVLLLPFTNAIPRATGVCPVGLQKMPFFANLPVGVSHLLRVSGRITLARGMVAILLAVPFITFQLMIFQPEENLWFAAGLIAAILIFWMLSRPLFVWYRLQTFTRRRNGVWLLHSFLQLVSMALAICWLASGLAAIVAVAGLCSGEVEPQEMGFTWLLMVGGMALSGLCARAVFEIFHWQLKRCHFDWISKY